MWPLALHSITHELVNVYITFL